jgi:predicted Zn-dependent peptidase
MWWVGVFPHVLFSLSEKSGLAYSVYSYHTAFSDTGLFTFYAGTSPTKYDEVLQLLFKEIKNVYNNGITEKELTRAKEQIKGNLFLGLESVSSRMTRLGRNELSLNRIITLQEVLDKIAAVTLSDVKTLAEELFGDNHFTLSTIGPLDKPLSIESFQL